MSRAEEDMMELYSEMEGDTYEQVNKIGAYAEPAMPTYIYECDPELNTKCNKQMCFMNPVMPGPCHNTLDLNCAKQPLGLVKLVVNVSEDTAVAIIGNAQVDKDE